MAEGQPIRPDLFGQAKGECVDCSAALRHRNAKRCPRCRRLHAKAYHRAYRETHRCGNDAYKQQVKLWRGKSKLEALRHYSGGPPRCARCGFSDIRALCLDHIGSDGRHRKHHSSPKPTSGVWFYRSLIRLGFPVGLQVLCANCNLIKQHEHGEWARS